MNDDDDPLIFCTKPEELLRKTLRAFLKGNAAVLLESIAVSQDNLFYDSYFELLLSKQKSLAHSCAQIPAPSLLNSIEALLYIYGNSHQTHTLLRSLLVSTAISIDSSREDPDNRSFRAQALLRLLNHPHAALLPEDGVLIAPAIQLAAACNTIGESNRFTKLQNYKSLADAASKNGPPHLEAELLQKHLPEAPKKRTPSFV